jgi:hypothetical protein
MKLSNPLQIVSLIVLIIAGSAVPALGQFHEDFESTLPTWQRKGTDCIISDSNWDQRRTNDISARNRFEKIHFKNGPGTQIFVSHDVSPAFIIPELTPSVRINASRPGVEVLVRVVLPHTLSPTGEGPMTTMLSGPRYRATGKWETLSFAANKTDLQQQLQEEIWLLRRKFGAHVDQRDAYVDKIVLNLYSSAGESTVQIDDLKLSGIVSADAVASRAASAESVIDDPAVAAAGFTQQRETQKSLVVRDGTVLLVKKKPFFPIVIEHNGEPLDYLQALGFNTIELKSAATDQQLRQAQELKLWLICPAPASVGLVPIDFQYDRVLAWKIGEKLTSRDIPIVQQRVREIRESDKREGRPIVAHVDSDWSRLAQLVDVLAVGVEPIGTSFMASQYSDWISQRSQAIGNGKPIWADVQTQLSKSLVQQIGTLANKTPPIPVEPQQVKFLVYESIAGGARGLRFLSRTRLDGNDPVTRLRAQTLEWVNAEIAQLEPWAVGGAVMGEVATGNDRLEVTAINTNRSRLLLIQRPTHHEQYLAGDVPLKTVTFQDSDSSATDRAYLIGETALVPLANSKSHAGTQVQIENCPFSAAVVLTQDPLVVNKLTQSYERVGRQSTMQMHTELTQQWLAIMQLIDKQMGRMGRSSSIASGALNDAVNSFRTAQGLIDGSSPQTAVDYLNRTDERLSFMRREIITGPLGMFQSKTSTPFVVHCSLIPLHWELAGRLTSSEWNPNGLPGGDFENLQHMMSNGWENRRLDDDFLETKVELSDAAAIDGKYGLKLSVVPKRNSVGLVESTPLWIATPEIQVKGGQLVRIHGWANVPQVIQGSHDGLKITDTLGGAEMAERIPVTQGWQEFTLYRGVASTGTVQVTFSLNGIGEALLDEVTIRTIDLPPPGARQARK